jgi:deoxyribodipyrimidine photo-lyase
VRDTKNSRVANYQTGRNLVDGDNGSKISPYLAAGVISGRMVIRAAKEYAGGKLESGRDTGIGMWVQEGVFVFANCGRISTDRA